MSFFKAYDMRGTFGKDFDLPLVFRVGYSLVGVLREKLGAAADSPLRILVGRDGRITSPQVRDALVKGLILAGARVTDLGRVTTPMIYFHTVKGDYDGSVMITASHNPPSDNGLKVSIRGALPMGYESGLKEVEAKCAELSQAVLPHDLSLENAPIVKVDPEMTIDSFITWLQGHQGASLEGLRFAVDCSDGMAGILARKLFPTAEVILNDVIDGTFPHHSPNPLNAAARAQLAACVRERGLDCGVIFDGDADRCMFVDERGDFIQCDYLIPILASTFSAEERRNTLRQGLPVVIHDVRTSRGAIEALRMLGCETVMGKVGHAFAKVLLRETGAFCGGELAGHYYFRDFGFCDSGELAAVRILGAFAQTKRGGKKVSAFLAPIAAKYANSGELNFSVANKEVAFKRVLAAARTLGTVKSSSTIDGCRLEFEEGWLSIRPSNTEPYLRLIVECDTKSHLASWLEVLRGVLEK